MLTVRIFKANRGHQSHELLKRHGSHTEYPGPEKTSRVTDRKVGRIELTNKLQRSNIGIVGIAFSERSIGHPAGGPKNIRSGCLRHDDVRLLSRVFEGAQKLLWARALGKND